MQEELRNAAKCGDVVTVKRLLMKAELNVNSVNEVRSTNDSRRLSEDGHMGLVTSQSVLTHVEMLGGQNVQPGPQTTLWAIWDLLLTVSAYYSISDVVGEDIRLGRGVRVSVGVLMQADCRG